jgi:hypothetical protein
MKLTYWSRVLALILFALVLLYTIGCANPIVAPQSPQAVINETNVLLTASANVIAQNVKDGIYTKDEGNRYLGKVRELADKVDAAQKLVNSGLPDAKQQAEIVRSLVLALHREVAQRARQQ